MWLISGLQHRLVGKNRANPRYHLGTFVPRLEALEGRFLPSTTWTVLNPYDSGLGSLRAAIEGAQNGDTINFDSSLSGQTINLAGSPLNVTRNVTIDASAVGRVTVSGGGVSQVFTVIGDQSTNIGPTVAMKNITVTNGHTVHNGGGIQLQYGGNLTLTNCTVEHCDASQGGGIASLYHSVLTLDSCVIRGNTAGLGGGLANGTDSTAAATDTSFSDNTMTEPSEWGGGILNSNSSHLTLTRCQVLNNHGTGAGIGLANMGFGDTSPSTSTAVLTDCLIDGNRNDDVNNGGGGIFSSRSILSLEHCTVSHNGNGTGGGIASAGGEVTLGYCWIDSNTGGGVAAYGQGESISANPVTVANCTVTNNTRFANGLAGFGNGGGLYISMAGGETATIVNTTVANNSTDASGGGLHLQESVGGYVNTGGQINLTNCTIADNFAGGNGGGVSVWGAVQAFFVNCTISGNLVRGGLNDGAGAGLAARDSIPSLQNTAVGGNTRVYDSENSFEDNVAGDSFSLVGPNVFQYLWLRPFDTPVAPFPRLLLNFGGGTLPLNFVHLDYLFLGPLQDNGGPAVGAPGHTHALDTMAVLPPSLSWVDFQNHIPLNWLLATGADPDPLTGLPLVTDERGVLRNHPQDVGPDIGAYQHLAPQVADIHWTVPHASTEPQTIPNSVIGLNAPQRVATLLLNANGLPADGPLDTGLGIVTIDAQGNFVYTPKGPGATAFDDSFAFTVIAGGWWPGQSDWTHPDLVGHVFISFGPGDDFVSVRPGVATVLPDVLANDVKPGGEPVHLLDTTKPSHGTLVRNGDQLTYTPDAGVHGRDVDSFTYTITDPHGNTASATVHITVNTPPASGRLEVFAPRGAPGPITSSAATTDPDGDPLTYSLVAQPMHKVFADGSVIATIPTGTVTVDPDTGRWQFDPAPSLLDDNDDLVTVSKVFHDIEFVIRVSDGIDVVEASVYLGVPGNKGPAAARDDHFIVPVNDGVTTYYPENLGVDPHDPGEKPGAVRFAAPGVLWQDDHLNDPYVFLAGVVRENPLTAVLVPATGTNGPSHGTVTLRPDGSFTYTPDVGFRGQDSFRYIVTDGDKDTEPATVTIDVAPNIPVLHDQVYDIRPTDNLNHLVRSLIRDINPSAFGNDVSPFENRFGRSAFDIRRGPVFTSLPSGADHWETDIYLPATGNRFLSTYALELNKPVHGNDYILTNFATARVNIIDEDSDGDGITDREEITQTLPGDRGGKVLSLERDLSANAFDASVARVLVNDFDIATLQVTTPGATLAHVRHTDNPHPQDAPSGATFPVGFFSYELHTVPGGAATLEITLPPDASGNDFWKYGPTADVVAPDGSHPAHWYSFVDRFGGPTRAELGERTVPSPGVVNGFDVVHVWTLHLIDGQRGDDDLTPNGVIVEPGGPAFRVTAPTVQSVVLNDGSAQRSKVTSITISFSEKVTLAPGAFELKTARGRNIPLKITTKLVDGKSVAVLTFRGPGIIAGSLADGSYQLLIHGAKLRNASGTQLDGNRDGKPGGDASTAFFRKYGDADGDGDVDAADAELFAGAWGRRRGKPGYLWYFDFDGDGIIGKSDAARFQLRPRRTSASP